MSSHDWFSQMDWGLSTGADTGCGVLRIEPSPSTSSRPGFAGAALRAVSAWPTSLACPALFTEGFSLAHADFVHDSNEANAQLKGP